MVSTLRALAFSVQGYAVMNATTKDVFCKYCGGDVGGTEPCPAMTDDRACRADSPSPANDNDTRRITMIKATIATMLVSFALLGSAVANAAPAKGPGKAQDAMKAVATCKDGKTYSNATGEHRGACSGHGGVASWADGSPVKGKGKSGSYR